jgi:hypothetical protein
MWRWGVMMQRFAPFFLLLTLLLSSEVAAAATPPDDIEVYVIGFDIAKGSSQEANLKNFSSQVGGNYLSAEDATTSQALERALTSSYTGNLNQTPPNHGAFMQVLAGDWVMKGESTGVQNSNWVAVLTLKPDGTLGWRETEGATPGATRTGTWDYDGTTIILGWAAPKGGQTAWISTSVNDRSIEQGAYTAENAPSGVWSASKSGGISQRSRLQGEWRMEGRTTGVQNSDWVATLTLNSDGTLAWLETAGATAGASRTGTWDFDGTTITLRWTTPTGVQTIWTSSSVTDQEISNGVYSAENAQGTWSARKQSAI